MKLMFRSKTARGLFTDSKNNSHELLFMFRPHVGNKPRLKLRGNTDGTSRVPRFQSLSTQSMIVLPRVVVHVCIPSGNT